ncbi:MAG: tRNA (N6-isopentenyl adenosine(37)-C2)-methylthiotransferase MiaB [Clostridia bacterium]|nr:tRNA (N6-isopentenyl adenosine(37)-C2)-methylthiotransferase MiaB [Clostridia bacterium]
MSGYSEKNQIFIPPAELEKQVKFTSLVHTMLASRYPDSPKAFVHTYGCQGNVSDSEKIKGQLKKMGYSFVDSPEDADLVLFNTCAVREHAEDRVFGNVGALKPIKEKKKDMLIVLCGCMMQQKHIADRIKRSYPYVNLVFGTFAIHRLPEMLYTVLSRGKRVFEIEENAGTIAEGLPTERDRGAKAWLPIMYGCNNFCSYCIVPYVRGRERSRLPEDILAEARELVASGAKDITLLGQNVNSYGKNPDCGVNFASLIRQINDIEGDFVIRFMTSHPKDCTYELLDAMAECKKVARHLHLPVQSGNNRVLAEMNRKYTREQYLDLIAYAKKRMPDLSLTSDIIVGFPGETYEEFLDTVSLIKEVGYTSLFTFIYSKREGTKAASMPDPVSYKEKSKWFKELCDAQEEIAARRTASMVGKTYRVLVEPNDREGWLTGRTSGNISIDFEGDAALIGQFAEIEVTEAKTWILYGKKK